MNVNVIDFQIVAEELKDIRDQLDILDHHLKEMIEDFESANDCPACGSKSRTISVKLDNRSYYKTVCGNRRCHLEDIPGAYLYPDKHASVEFWNNFTDDWTP